MPKHFGEFYLPKLTINYIHTCLPISGMSGKFVHAMHLAESSKAWLKTSLTSGDWHFN